MTTGDELSLDELDPELLALIGASAPTVAPPASLRASLLDAVSSNDPRIALAGFSGRLRRLFDLSPRAVDDVLAAVARPELWETYLDGVSLFHFEPGPRELAAASRVDAGLVRFRAGMAYPRHRHLGEELTLVLRGGFREDVTGLEVVAGDLLHRAPGTVHGHEIFADEDCVVAVLLYDGLPEFVLGLRSVAAGRIRSRWPTKRRAWCSAASSTSSCRG